MKRYFILSLLLFMTYKASAHQVKQTFILIHGAWHGAWCWHKVTPLLTAQNFNVITIDLPGHGADTTEPDQVTLSDYVAKVKVIALQVKGPVILVGHSMSGVVISQAAEELGTAKVSKLVYLDAFLPQNGESVSSLARLIESSLPGDSSRLTIANGLIIAENHKTSTFKPEIADQLFYNDCSLADKAFAHKRLSKQALAPLGTPVSVSNAVYGVIPKYYILCTNSKDLDKTLLPTRVKCKKVYTLYSGHSPFFSMPKKLVALLSDIAKDNPNSFH
jgi:pimeloyl-ACP methyl ester carboxylesterase